MSKSTLTPKQAYYLKQLQDAEANGQSIKALAEQLSIRIEVLYNYRYTLRKKGWLTPVKHSTRREKSTSTSFMAVPSATSPARFQTLALNSKHSWPMANRSG